MRDPALAPHGCGRHPSSSWSWPLYGTPRASRPLPLTVGLTPAPPYPARCDFISSRAMARAAREEADPGTFGLREPRGMGCRGPPEGAFFLASLL